MDPKLQQIIDRAIADGLGDDDIDLLVQEHKARATPNQVTAKAEDYYTPNVFQKDGSTSIGEAAVGAVKNVAGMVPAVVDMVKHPLAAIENATAARHAAWNKGNDPSKGLLERGAYKAAGLVPFLGPAMVAAGEKLGSGNPETMGAGVSDVAMMSAVSPSVRAGAKATVATVGKKAAAKFPRTAAAVKTAVDNPMVATIGAYEGYQHAGIPGAIAGAVGLPMGKIGLMRELGKVIRGGSNPRPQKAPAQKPAVDPVAAGMTKSTGIKPAVSAEPAPAAPIGKSKSKRPTYTENDLKAAKEKWGSTDVAELRTKFGQEVDDYLLAKRAERHSQHYNTAKEQAVARRADVGGEGELAEQLRMALLEQQKRRGK